jgi:solute carrier family 45 protein 1/2/4
MEGDGKEAANKRLDWATMNLEAGGKGDGGIVSQKPPMSIFRLFLACMVSGGIQYGWALQLSLLSPYSQVRMRSISSLFSSV